MTSEDNRAQAVIGTLRFTVRRPCAVTVLAPLLILAVDYSFRRMPGMVKYLGFATILVGAIAYIWCASAFVLSGEGTPGPRDPPRVLVTKGLYRYTRNPMFVGILSILFGEAIVFRSVAILIYASALGIRWHMMIVSEDEPRLKEIFGQRYEQYCQKVPRWLW